MKLTAAAVSRSSRAPDWSRTPGVLLFGPDRGLAREISRAIVTAVAGAPDDPFRVTVLEPGSTKADPARLPDELNALAFTGGRRVVWLREAGDGISAEAESALALLDGQDPASRNILVIEAGDLEYRSSLRKLFEGHPRATAILCGSEGASGAETLIKSELHGSGHTISPEALSLLAERLSDDRALARQTLEKILLFLGTDGPREIDEAVVLECAEDPETAGYQDVVDALLDGNVERLDRSFHKAIESGVSPVGLLRAAARALQRVDQVLRVARGGAIDSALGALRPPLPFSARATFAAQCRAWTLAALDEGLTRILTAESQCKTTGFPEDVIASRALMGLASRHRGARRTR